MADMDPAQALAQREHFLADIQQHLATVLDATATVFKVVSSRTPEDMQSNDESFSTDTQQLADAVAAFSKSTEAVAESLTEQILKLPAPVKISRAPYLDALAMENIKEAASIQHTYELKLARQQQS